MSRALWMVLFASTVQPGQLSAAKQAVILKSLSSNTAQVSKLSRRFIVIKKLLKNLSSNIDDQVLCALDIQNIKQGQFTFAKILDRCAAMLESASERIDQANGKGHKKTFLQCLGSVELSICMLEKCYESFMQMQIKLELLSLGEHEIGDAALIDKPLTHRRLQCVLCKVYLQLSERCSKSLTQLVAGLIEEPAFVIDVEDLLPVRLQKAWYKPALLQASDSLYALLQADYYFDYHQLFKRYLLIMKHLNKVNVSREVIQLHNIPAQLSLLIEDFQDCIFSLSQQKHQSLSRSIRSTVMQAQRLMSFYCARLQLVKTEVDQLLNYNPTPEQGFAYMKHQLVTKDYDVYFYLKKFKAVDLYHRYVRLVQSVLFSNQSSQSIFYELYELIDDLKRIKEKNQPSLVKKYLGLENNCRNNFFNSVDRLIEVLTLFIGIISKKIGKQLPSNLSQQGGVGSGDIVGHLKQWLGQQPQSVKSISLKTIAIASPFLAAGLAKYLSSYVSEETKKKLAKSISSLIYNADDESAQVKNLTNFLKNNSDLARKVQEELDKAAQEDDKK